MQKKALVIINQHTAKPKLRSDLLELLDIFTRGGYACVIRPTQNAGDAARYTALNAGMFDLVVCVGGDGTLNEVISGLCALLTAKRPPIGYIPAGTTNDFASSINLSTDLLEAAKHIVLSKPHKMDCGSLNGHIFNYIASVGAFSEVSYETPQPMKNRLGHFAYLLEGIKHLADIKPYRLKFTSSPPGEPETVFEGNFAFAAFLNTLSIGGVIKLAPSEVKFDDGLHEYLFIRMPKSIADLNEVAIELMSLQNPKRKPGAKWVLYDKFSRGRLECSDDLQWSLDGECFVTGRDVIIENVHAAYRLMTHL